MSWRLSPYGFRGLDSVLSNKRAKGPDIGLHQAKRLCQSPQQQRLDFIAEGLPIILDSAQGFWAASQKLEDLPREAKVLGGGCEDAHSPGGGAVSAKTDMLKA